jgi:hypothetical protein
MVVLALLRALAGWAAGFHPFEVSFTAAHARLAPDQNKVVDALDNAGPVSAAGLSAISPCTLSRRPMARPLLCCRVQNK